MNKKKIMIVFGTRPEAIKMASVCKSFLEESTHFDTSICVTGQHREMLDQVLEIFDIKPDFNLSVMKDNQDLYDITSSILLGIRDRLKEFKPDLVLIHGDTTTTLATSMACFYSDVPIGHVEAGLRTHNINAPFPEEFNRKVASLTTKLHFAPTKLSQKNLLDEGIEDSKIFVTGNTVIDALQLALNSIEIDQIKRDYIYHSLTNLLEFDLTKEKYILITGHRRENFGKGFENICSALSEIASKYPEIKLVYPVHLNPNVQEPVNKILDKHSNICLIEPQDYEPFIILLKHCFFVLTDSGGIQEEAPSLGKPVLVMRDVTERPEAILAGTVKLVGADKDSIILNIVDLIESQQSYNKMSKSHNPFGDGNASRKILEAVKKEFKI